MVEYKNYEVELYPDLLRLSRRAGARRGLRPLFLKKSGSNVEEISYRRFASDVDALGTELLARGYAKKHVMIVGENSYGWACAYVAVAGGLGVAVPADPKLDATELASIAQAANVSLVICSARLQKKLNATDLSVKTLTFTDLDALIHAGKLRLSRGDRRFADLTPDPDRLCTLLYPAGANGRAIMLSNTNLCFSLAQISRMVEIKEDDVFLSVLPLHHAYETVCGFLLPLSRGAAIGFSSGLHELSLDMRLIRPTVIIGVPRLCEAIHTNLQKNLRDRGLESKLKLGLQSTNALGSERARLAARRKIFSGVHRAFGGRLRLILSCGANQDPSVAEGLRNLGIGVLQGYAVGEATALIALNRDECSQNRSVGMPLPATLLDVYNEGEDGIGEIRCRGKHVMLGYCGNAELTEERIRGGWLHTGDVGYIDADGFLHVIGKKRNAIALGDGFVCPEELEVRLLTSRFVRECVVVGYQQGENGSVDLVAIIHPDYEQIESLYGFTYRRAQLELELKRAIAEVNASVLPQKRIKAFLVRETAFPKTASGAIPRGSVADLYRKVYSGEK